jgi:hypothetical protein
MSTNSSIWIQNADGTFEGVYCHWDGYVDGVGATLAHHYTDERKVRNLISLGSISSLEKYTGHGFIGSLEDHSFDKPMKDVTVAYHRDRGEDLDIWTESLQECTTTEEYNYVFVNGTWHVAFEETNFNYETVGSHLSVEKAIPQETFQIEYT